MTSHSAILSEVCSIAERQVMELYPGLDITFIQHPRSGFAEIVEMREHDIFKNPSVKSIQTILEKNQGREQSGFLGLLVFHEIKWFGLASTEKFLALLNLNVDEFSSPQDARHEIYHLLWHAIDLLEIRNRAEYADKFRSGPMIPRRSALNLARLNLQADVFSAIMCGLQGEPGAMQKIASKRISGAITATQMGRAEEYPFVIAMETTQYAFEELLKLAPQRSRYSYYARQIAIEVGRTIEDGDIQDWWAFAEPSLDMAWKNISQEMILGSALYTSDNPFVRSTAHLASEITGIIPLSNPFAASYYNGFVDQEQNRALHHDLMDKTFSEAIGKGVKEESNRPLILAANEQNKKLAEGMILGWCGGALQTAARAFESALKTGSSPLQAAKMQFEGTKDEVNWETLRKIGSAIMEQKRQGYSPTLASVVEICSNNNIFALILGSVRATIKDPDYIHHLQAANDINLSAPSPRLPEPVSTPAPPAQPPAPNYAGPTFSGPGGFSFCGKGTTRLPSTIPVKITEQNETSTGKDSHQ